MNWQWLHTGLFWVQHAVSLAGVLIIVTGVFAAFCRYIIFIMTGQGLTEGSQINEIRVHLGRTLILGLEFIVAADLIGTTTTPDYYAVGLLAIIVVIRTLLSFSINRELMSIKQES
ncbi:MAG: DUF1622 domain-containing protein [Gammaproteobacteria bacterium]|nr:DUF1622 domain-containing protein [Gammaproteobacteria bacterium]